MRLGIVRPQGSSFKAKVLCRSSNTLPSSFFVRRTNTEVSVFTPSSPHTVMTTHTTRPQAPLISLRILLATFAAVTALNFGAVFYGLTALRGLLPQVHYYSKSKAAARARPRCVKLMLYCKPSLHWRCLPSPASSQTLTRRPHLTNRKTSFFLGSGR